MDAPTGGVYSALILALGGLARMFWKEHRERRNGSRNTPHVQSTGDSFRIANMLEEIKADIAGIHGDVTEIRNQHERTDREVRILSDQLRWVSEQVRAIQGRT